MNALVSYQDSHKVVGRIACVASETPCIGRDQTKHFYRHLKTVEGTPIVPPPDAFYLKVQVIAQVAPFKSEEWVLPSSLFEGAFERDRVWFYRDLQLVEMELRQQVLPFDVAFSQLKAARKSLFKPGYERAIYSWLEAPKDVLHIHGRILSPEARVKDLLSPGSWEPCTQEVCEEFSRHETVGRARRYPAPIRWCRDSAIYCEFNAIGPFKRLKVLIDKGMIRLMGTREQGSVLLPLFDQIWTNDYLKHYDRDSFTFALQEEKVIATGRVVQSSS